MVYFWENKALISVTLSWLNLLSNVRKFPFLGIYVVMFTDVLQTFLKFSIICALFIIAFALGFYAVFAEQVCMLQINTSYLNNSYIIFTLKMESVPKITIFGLKMMVKSGLEKYFWNSSMRKPFSSNSFYLLVLRKITNSVTKTTIFPHGGKSEIFFCHMYLT